MSAASDGYRVGRGRPPIETRWKKGRSGNSRKRKRIESTVAVIDRLLLRQIRLSLNGETQKETALAAIVLQLLQKAMSGNVRASRALVKYQEFANQSLEKKLDLTFLESNYTRAVAFLGAHNDDR
jgi:hypothetical protein